MSTNQTETIACAICGKRMASINNRHLATHQITAQEYRARFPDHPMISPAAAARKTASAEKANAGRKGVSRSSKDLEAIRAGIARRPSRKGIAHGPMSDETKKKLSEKAIAGFADGSRRAPMQGKRVPDEIRQKISASLVGRKCTQEHVNNATNARMKNNPDWAPMRGKTHSAETLQRISESSIRYFDQTRPSRRKHMLDKFRESNLILLNSVEEPILHLKCLKCGHEFSRTPQCFQPSKYHVEHCDQCFPISPVSEGENEVAAYVASIIPTAKMIRSDMETLRRLGDNRELDIVLPEYGLAIEYNGLYRHSELAGKQRYYHRSKLETCLKAGLRLITIFEDEWQNKRGICESMLINALNANPSKIDARKCSLRKITSTEANIFLDENHIQGHGRSNERYGLVYRDELVAVMTFMKGEVSRKQTGWEINRFCSKAGLNVRGGAGRLFSAFIREYDPSQVTTYADLRWGTGAVYEHIGFVRTGRGIGSTPNYWYFYDRAKPLKRVHRYALRKNKDDPPGMTEWQARQSQGWNRIWDCGHAKWVWTSPA